MNHQGEIRQNLHAFLKHLKSVAQHYQGPLVISEYGYRVLGSAMSQPCNEMTLGTFNPQLQAQPVTKCNTSIIGTNKPQVSASI